MHVILFVHCAEPGTGTPIERWHVYSMDRVASLNMLIPESWTYEVEEFYINADFSHSNVYMSTINTLVFRLYIPKKGENKIDSQLNVPLLCNFCQKSPLYY